MFLELVKELAGLLGIEIDALTAKKVAEDGYVDDNLSGGTEEEVNKMIGETRMVEGKYCYTGSVSRILKLVGLIPKVIVRSGCKDAGAIEKLGGRVLGHIWRPELDQIIFKLEVNLHEKIHGVVTGPSLTLDTLHIFNTEVFTNWKVLSIISSFYDPMGLISAYLVIFKIKMRETTALPDMDWDTPLPEEMQKD